PGRLDEASGRVALRIAIRRNIGLLSLQEFLGIGGKVRFVARIGVARDREELKPRIGAKMLLDFHQMRKLDQAGGAPRPPKIDERYLTFQTALRDGPRLARERLQVKRGQLCPNRRMLGSSQFWRHARRSMHDQDGD